VPGDGRNLAAARYGSLLSLCERCVNDAGFQSGMAGASRCELVERATSPAFVSGVYPEEWQLRSDGTLSCSAFTADDETDILRLLSHLGRE
jgi:hypothetical protein